MTIQASKIVGFPVLINSGEAVDKVEDIIFDAQSRRVLGYLMKNLDISSERRVLKIEDVERYESDCVRTDSEHLIKNVYETGDVIAGIVHDDSFLTEVSAKTMDGKYEGKLIDIFFDAWSGQVEKYQIEKPNEVIFSVWDYQVKKLEKNSIYIDYKSMESDQKKVVENGADELKELHEKVEGALSRLEKTISTYQSLLVGMQMSKMNGSPSGNGEVSELNEDVPQHMPRAPNKKSSESGNGILDPHAHEAVGKFLNKNILMEDDRIFAKKGEIVTHNMLYEALETGVLIELLANTTFRKPASE